MVPPHFAPRDIAFLRLSTSALLGVALALGGCDGEVSGSDVADARIVDGVVVVDDGSVDGSVDAADDATIAMTNPLEPRVENTTCTLPEAGNLSDYDIENAFPSQDPFNRPIWVGLAPGDTNTMFVAQQGGTIFAFDNRSDAPSRETFLDITVTRAGNEEGLLGLAFHPSYARNGRFFLNYSSVQGCPSGFSRCSVISEFARSGPRTADAGSEQRLLVVGQPFGNHNGGAMEFGPDGYLYISLGDGGSGGDPMNHGQRTETLLGNILRIDVDNVPAGEDYGIPPGNPFVGEAGRDEIWSWGLRNVWRFSFDPVDGALWAGDVGQNSFEEIDKITEPSNLGWKIREGFECFGAATCRMDGLLPPVHVYGRGEGRSVTGGVVYRGTALRELWGRYIFGDFQDGPVWALEEVPGGMARETRLFNMQNPGHFGVDENGEVLIASFNGRVFRLVRSDGAMAPEPLPMLLSETGCFSDTANHVPAAGVIPYGLNVPFWSDGLNKDRFIALPEGETATMGADGSLEFPVGTLFLKTFYVQEAGAPARRRLETRIMARQMNAWRGFTWRWNDDQSDAVLLEGAQTETIDTNDGSLEWNFPSSSQCNACHTEAAGFALGFRAQQLNRFFDYPEGRFDQLEALSGAGYISEAGAVAPFPRLDDAAAPLEDRARAYLDTNCAMCHQPTGPGNASIDLRAATSFAEAGLCDAPVEQGDLGIAGARIFAPGDVAASVLHARINRRGDEQMPPLASTRVDTQGAALLADWINSVAACP
ncbi:MAG: PQQ-dependent sugar dehydrogenase [Myxococcota bacterium]